MEKQDESDAHSDAHSIADAPALDREKPTGQISSPDKHSIEDVKIDEANEEEWQYITGFKLGIVIVSVTLVAFVMMLDMSIVSTAIPRITSDFHSLPDVGWYGSAYLLANCSLQPLTGKFYTYFSSKYTFLVFLGIFELGSLLCGVANSSDMLIVGRAVAGMGASGIMNGSITILAACLPMVKRPVYLGIIMSFAQFGFVLGPLIGGLLTQYTTWRWCFYINLPIGGAVAILLMLIKIPDRTVKIDAKSTIRTSFERFDILGFVLFAPFAIQLLLALQWGGSRYSWDTAKIIGLFCGSFGTFCVFLAWEYRQGDGAMIPVPMVRQRIVWSGCLVTFFFMGSTLCTTYYLPIYFQAVRDATPTMSGVYILPAILSQIIFATVSGVLVGRQGYYLPWSIASGILTAIGTGLLSMLTPTTSTAKWVGFQILAGSGRGMGMQMPIVAIQNLLPSSQNSVGMSLAIFSQTFGGALALSFAQTAFNNGLTTYIPAFAPGVNAQTVIEAGATAVRAAVPKASLEGVLEAYNKSINNVFYLATACACGAFLFCWGMGWKNIKKAKVVAPEG